MDITKQSIGSNVYFIDRNINNNVFVVEYGTITGVIPKYNFQDKFAQNYARNENILISVKMADGELKTKVVNDAGLVFNSVEDAIKYCLPTEIVFGYSAVKGEL